MKHIFLLAMLFALTTFSAFAQETFRVGDTVGHVDGRIGKILSIYQNPSSPEPAAKVQWGNDKYSLSYIAVKDLMTPQTAALKRQQIQQDEAQTPLRNKFDEEAYPYRATIFAIAQAYNPTFGIQGGMSDDAKMQKDLEDLNALCQNYRNMTNPPKADPRVVKDNPADWCKIAENPPAMMKKVRVWVAGMNTKQALESLMLKLDQTMKDPDGYVKDNVQMMLYNRAEWERTELKEFTKQYAAIGEAIPADVMKSFNEKAAELKAQIERSAPTRSWEQPQYTDAALEAMIKKAFSAEYLGAKVFKTGMTYTTWKAVDDTSLVGSGTGYKIYRTTKGAYRYKLGLALVKLPNQPFCQIREFEFIQNKAGAGYAATKLSRPLGYTGIFVQCP